MPLFEEAMIAESETFTAQKDQNKDMPLTEMPLEEHIGAALKTLDTNLTLDQLKEVS